MLFNFTNILLKHLKIFYTQSGYSLKALTRIKRRCLSCLLLVKDFLITLNTLSNLLSRFLRVLTFFVKSFIINTQRKDINARFITI